MKNEKYFFAMCLLGIAIILAYAFPRSQYSGTDILSRLQVPSQMKSWNSRDLSDTLDPKDVRYNFKDRVFSRQYTNDLGESLVFFILNAVNFHHPQTCFGNSGYEVKPQQDLEINANGRRFKAHVLFMKKKQGSLLVVYWICIDKKTVDWTEQKFDQFFYSLFNKKKAGLMGRLDIPASEENLQQAARLAKDLIGDVSRNMRPEEADYLFGAST
jgi:EpsI family protein